MRELDRLSSDTSQTMQTEVNKVVSDINDVFNDAARSLGMFRSDEINKAVRKYKQQVIHKIRNLKYENPRDYWNIINNKNNSKTTAKVSLEIFKEHFENLNYSHDNQNVPTLDFNDSDPLLNDPFTTEEVTKLIAKLKNYKSPGTDHILNEFLKNSPRQITTILSKLFNVILASGIVPEQWSIKVIKPIYKSSGDDTDPSKFFSNLINHGLTLFVDNNNIIGPEQAGFRAGFSATDHMFAIKTLIDLYNHKRKKIFCCFVDYSKAFDSISRTKLWHKLLESNISGKIFILVHSMYKTAKSCVTSNGQISDTFPCLGVRQGENLSPLLFSIYLGDLQLFLQDAHKGLTVVNKMTEDRLDESLLKYLKLYVLLYADDTVLVAKSAEDLQKSIVFYIPW